ncbi:MAG: hypothetical protein ACLFR9_07170 [Desulfobacterales bacterium]
MQIRDPDIKSKNGRTRAEALVTWEDCGEPEKRVFIETPDEYSDGIHVSADAFLSGCIIPALHFGEKRIAVEGEVCPGLLEGLDNVMELMRVWTGGEYQPLRVEPQKTAGSARGSGRGQTRAGMFYSGGIDSIAALRINMRNYPRAHPGRVRDCFFVHGFDIGGVPARGMKYHVFDRGLAAMQNVASAAGVATVPVYTNIRHLCDDRELWLNRFFGAVLAAVGHAFSPRVDLFYIASSYDFENLAPCGSHPMLDPEYSSFNLRIRHRDAAFSRLDKMRVVAGWQPGLDNMRVCLANVEDRLNCGKCEKCVRTMTGLAALGVLDKTWAFEENDVNPDMFDGFKINIRHREPFYIELLPLLEKQGRHDIAKTIRKKLEEQ